MSGANTSKDQPRHAQAHGAAEQLQGAPGVQIPLNAGNIEELRAPQSGATGGVGHTALPLDESLKRQDAERQRGAPGVQIVQNPENIPELREVRNVDSRELNERMRREA